MNQGERDELLIQIKLIELRDSNYKINEIGTIESISFENEYKKLPNGYQLNDIGRLSDYQLIEFAKHCGITKASTNYKADTKINDEPISLKSTKKAPPALVNHTTRPGFEFAANNAGVNISLLDDLINEYWELRLNGLIGEDVTNENSKSPFKENKDIIKPYLNYFLFYGTGSSLSKLPAKRILSFSDPLKPKTWKFYNESNAIDLYWNKLVFSLRAKKGMPNGYPNDLSKKILPFKSSIDKWTKHIDGDYRGALHIRSKS
jgi:hypothetical protein